MLAEQMNVGYTLSALIFGAAIALTTLAYYKFGLNAVWAFWIAYVLTRPFGASCGDLLTQSPKDGGLGLGTNVVSAVFLVVIVALVAYLTTSRVDLEEFPDA